MKRIIFMAFALFSSIISIAYADPQTRLKCKIEGHEVVTKTNIFGKEKVKSDLKTDLCLIGDVYVDLGLKNSSTSCITPEYALRLVPTALSDGKYSIKLTLAKASGYDEVTRQYSKDGSTYEFEFTVDSNTPETITSLGLPAAHVVISTDGHKTTAIQDLDVYCVFDVR